MERKHGMRGGLSAKAAGSLLRDTAASLGDRESWGGEALLGRGGGPCGLERDALGVVRISWLLR